MQTSSQRLNDKQMARRLSNSSFNALAFNPFSSSLSSLSAYPRIEEHVVHKTTTGAIVSLSGLMLMLVLFVSEFLSFVQPVQKQKMQVDVEQREQLEFFFNITFDKVPCALLRLDTLDHSGSLHANVAENTFKMRLGASGQPLAPAVETKDTFSHVQIFDLQGHSVGDIMFQDANEATSEMMKTEGCNMWGDIMVLFAKGSIGFGFDRNLLAQMPDLYVKHRGEMLISHTIHSFSLGETFPGKVNPLDGLRRQSVKDKPERYNYFLKLVPTRFITRFGRQLDGFQYSLAEYRIPMPLPYTNNHDGGHEDVQKQIENFQIENFQIVVPSLLFNYDISPIMAVITDESKGIIHFVVRMCAVIGGAFAITRFVDTILHNLSTKKKA